MSHRGTAISDRGYNNSAISDRGYNAMAGNGLLVRCGTKFVGLATNFLKAGDMARPSTHN